MNKCFTKLKFYDHVNIYYHEGSIFEFVGFEIMNKKIYTLMLFGTSNNGYTKKEIVTKHRDRDFKFSNNIDENDIFYWVYQYSITKIILK
jgi:hypothetical protein